MKNKLNIEYQSNYDLKHREENLFSKVTHTVTMPLKLLEAMRTSKEGLPASKYGLETICGISCETGAW